MLIHSFVVPFMIFHWICNNNLCALTLIEKGIRKFIYGKVKSEDCITCKIIEPVYDFKKNNSKYASIIYLVTISIWLLTVGKLYYKFKTGKITSLMDFFLF